MHKILYVFFICLLITSVDANAQQKTMKFELYLFDYCADTVGRIGFYTLTKDGVNYYPNENSGIVYLSDIGSYKLSTIYLDDPLTYEIKKVENVLDTLTSATVYLALEPPTSHPDFIGYFCCDHKCEGEKTDYYSNGSKRLEGCFKDGKPLGDLKIYYPNGMLKQLDKYSKRGKHKKRVIYDEKGEIKSLESY